MRPRTVGILGLARSGHAAAKLALARGEHVFASDAASSADVAAAAAEIRALGGDAETGGHSTDRLAQCDLLVVSPGIPPDAAVLQNGALAHVPRISEIEYAFQWLAAPVLCVTGTNGKSTTTALAAHLLQAAELDAPAAGNIGLALSEIALRDEPPDWVVVEASSFQLAGVDRFAPRIGVVTNLSPDHLDRYATVADYYGDKANLFSNASPSDVWVLNGEDEAVRSLPSDAPGRRRYFRTELPLLEDEEGGYVGTDGALVLRENGRDAALVNVTELRLLGRHNWANALAASIAAVAAGANPVAVAAGLRSFAGLAHRLEVVAEAGGVAWINDSKATNVSSTRVALRSMTRPTVVLLGGRHKGEPYASLADDLREHARVVIAYGEAGPIIVADVGEYVPVLHVAGPFEDVVDTAARCAQPGDAILLSPACSSYDMFRNFEERGRRFTELAGARTEPSHG
ncbi:MAG: UDP-N-acetylmuramoyl-L-alanine--D-glutamate ligase [Longimicrobiales bacterium]